MTRDQDREVLTVEALRFSYPEGPEVLHGIDLRVCKGERVALAGPNGSGKTTLFLLLCGVSRPATGSIAAAGRVIKPGRFNPQIAYLFQSPDDQLFSATVFDDVAFGPLNMDLPRQEVRQRVAEALRRVGAEGLAERPPHHLSGGEKRLAAMATVLAMSPEIILLDEPTSNLDSRNRRQVIQILNEAPQTILVASHDLEFLLETCQRVFLLDGGHVVADGPIRHVLADEALLHAHGLEKPHSLVPHSHHGPDQSTQ